MATQGRPAGITALSLFFTFGASMSGLAVLMLLFPRSFLEPLWQLNPHAREGFASLGIWAVLLMSVVCFACASGAVGLWRCKRWGLWTAVAILSINFMGDTVNAAIAHDWRSLIGLPIAAIMIYYLLRKPHIFTH